MKRLIALFTVGVILSSLPIIAHPGRTDGDGGHYNRSSGEYHYHHGFSAHQHPDGICPYDYEDRTSHSSGSSSNRNSIVIDDLFDEPEDVYEETEPEEHEDTKPKKNSAWKKILEILTVIGFWYGIFLVPWLLSEGFKWIKNRINNKRK